MRALLLIAACTPVGPLHVDLEDTRRGTGPDLLTPACDLLEVECVEGEDVTLVLTETCSTEFCGKTRSAKCWAMAFAEDDERTVAHELAHALGLTHTDHEGLMHKRHGRDLTDDQRDQIDDGLRRLARCKERTP